MWFFISLFVSLAIAQVEPDVRTDTGSEKADVPSEPDTPWSGAAWPDPPPSLSTGTIDFGELTDDPGFDRWFDGAIRVERGDDVLFSLASGNDVGGEALGQDSIFWIGSISKTFCSTAVLHLVDEGKLALDDPIGAHLPGWEPNDATMDGEVCTVARLLAHECGFPREPPTMELLSLKDPLRNEENRGPYLEAARGIELEFVPGTDKAYSNVGYELAGLLVVAKGEGSYDEILQRRLFAPLGLVRTGTEPSRVPGFFDRVAPMAVTVGSVSLSATRWLGLPEDAPSRVGAAGNGFSTPRELTRFFEALTQGEILKPETFSEMTRQREADKEYGLGIISRDRDGSPEYWHNGALEPHGYNTHISTFPTWDTTVTVLVARGVMVTSAGSVAQRLIDAILDKDYRSPFPNGVMDWLMANIMALVFILIPAWVSFRLLLASFRPIQKPRLSWALGVANNACVLILLRGLLGIHGDGIDQWIWPTAVAGVVTAMIWWRLSNEQEQPIRAIHASIWRRGVAWMNLLLTVLIMPAIAWFNEVYQIQFMFLIAVAIGFAVKRSTPAS